MMVDFHYLQIYYHMKISTFSFPFSTCIGLTFSILMNYISQLRQRYEYHYYCNDFNYHISRYSRLLGQWIDQILPLQQFGFGYTRLHVICLVTRHVKHGSRDKITGNIFNRRSSPHYCTTQYKTENYQLSPLPIICHPAPVNQSPASARSLTCCNILYGLTWLKLEEHSPKEHSRRRNIKP